MSPLISFIWGFVGSLAVEIVAINQAWNSTQGEMPARYRNPWFWIARLLLAVLGGGLTVAYKIVDSPILAINIGASTPLIIQTLSRGVTEKVARLPSVDE